MSVEPSAREHPRSVGSARADAIRHLKAEHYERLLVGGMALVVPTLMIVADLITVPGSPTERGSLSAYYYSPLRDVFVGGACALGALLIAHRIAERSVENLLTTVGGVGAIVVALFPTSRPPGMPRLPLVALQRQLGESAVTAVHTGGASLMLTVLFALTLVYAARQGRLPPTGRWPPHRWRIYHLLCAGVMLAAGVYTLLANGLGVLSQDASLLYSECMAIGGFGLSWVALGLNPRVLRLPRPESVDDHVPFEER